MTTQTSLVAVQVRLRQWAEQIRDCQNRPEGMDVETWCSQNHITKSNYYYRLRRVCKAYLDQIPGTEIPAFVELPALDTANYVQTECQFRYCGTAIPFLTVRSTAR